MDISDYTTFFHDGTIEDIRHTENNIVFSISSAQLGEEENKDKIPLSKDDRIQGLCCTNPRAKQLRP